jgi:hypothetical protein
MRGLPPTLPKRETASDVNETPRGYLLRVYSRRMESDLDSVLIALTQLQQERANLLAERRRLLQEPGGGWSTSCG